MQYQTTFLQLLSCFMYVSTSISFSQSWPFRTRIYKNRLYFLSLIILYLFNMILVVWQPIKLFDFMQLRIIPDQSTQWVILIFALLHLVLSVSFEFFIIEQPLIWNFLHRMCSGKVKRYEELLNEINNPPPKIERELRKM